MFNAVLDFWFKETDPALWWAKNETFDQLITARFTHLHQQASRCELFAWRSQPKGRLAEILILDQFSRNLFRDSPRAFAQDALALALAQEAIAAGTDQALKPVERSFLYLPFMHSESPLIHQTAVTLYSQPGLAFNLDFEHQHKAIIDRFGRYPHRNALLGRESTLEEITFLMQPGSSF